MLALSLASSILALRPLDTPGSLQANHQAINPARGLRSPTAVTAPCARAARGHCRPGRYATARSVQCPLTARRRGDEGACESCTTSETARRDTFCNCEHDGCETQAAHRTFCYRSYWLVILRLGDSGCAVPSCSPAGSPPREHRRTGSNRAAARFPGLTGRLAATYQTPAAAAGHLQRATGDRGAHMFTTRKCEVGADAGKWYTVVIVAQGTRPVGYCALGCPGHNSSAEALAHHLQYQLDREADLWLERRAARL
jgi:hypothetical protein